MRKIEFSEEQQKEIIKLVTEQKMGAERISKIFNVSKGTMQKFLRQHNLKGELPRKHSVDQDFFEVIDTEEKAYWLGFLYADGVVYKERNTVALVQKPDESGLKILKEFQKAVKGDYEIIFHTQLSWGTETEIARYEIYSSKMVSDLINKGCVPKKSLVLTFPDNSIVPQTLKHHFIRGYFDGDGSITTGSHKYKIADRYIHFSGTKEFLEGVRAFLSIKAKVIPDKRYLDRNIYCLGTGGNPNILRIFEILYKDATIYLDRKYERFLKLKQEYYDNKTNSLVCQ